MRTLISLAAVASLVATASADDRWPTLTSKSQKVLWSAPTTQPDKPTPATCSRPVISPDGRKVAFFVNEPGGSRLLLLSADDGAQVCLLSYPDPKAECSQLGFSPDGGRLAAIVRHKSQSKTLQSLVVGWAKGENNKPAEQLSHESVRVFEFAFAPDGRTLAAATDRGVGLFSLAPGGAGFKLLVQGQGNQEQPSPFRQLRFAPNGSFFTAIGLVKEPFTVVGQGPGVVVFTDTQFATLPVSVTDLAISPDSRKVAGAVWTHSPVGVERPGGVMVWDVADLRAGKTAGRWALDPKRFIGGNHTYPGGAFWIEGRLCALATEIAPEPGQPFRRFGVWQVQPDGPGSQPGAAVPHRLSIIGPMPKRMWPDPAGRGLVFWRYAGDEAGMFFLDDRTGRCLRFHDKLNTRAWTLSVSPDLKRLAVVKGGQLIVHELTEAAPAPAAAPSFPPSPSQGEGRGEGLAQPPPAVHPEAAAPHAPAGLLRDPWVRTDRSVDCRSRETILADLIKPGQTSEQKAVAIWRFVVDHTWHFSRADENDPLRLFTVYGYSLCGTLSRMQNWLREGVFPASYVADGGCGRYGTSRAEREAICRGWLIDSWERLDGGQKRPGAGNLGHSMGEVFYDGHWHFLDPHGVFYVYTADGGRIAGYADLQTDPTLVSDPVRTSDPFMPYDGGHPLFYYRLSGAGGRGVPDPNAKPNQTRRPAPPTHMAVSLRPGERYVRSWQPIPGAFKWSGSWKGQWDAGYIDGGPRHVPSGPDTWRHYANGQLIYTLPLNKPAAARAGLAAAENIAFAADDGKGAAVHPADPAKPMAFTVAVQSPYVLIRGRVTGKVIVPAGGSAAVVLKVGSKESSLWQSDQAGQADLDVAFDKPLGYGYAYELTVRVSGGGVGALTVESTFQINPLTLPRLMPGRNVVTVTAANPAKLATLGPLLVTYAWQEKSGEKRHVEKVNESPHSYVIEVGELEGAEPADPSCMRSLELSLPAR